MAQQPTESKTDSKTDSDYYILDVRLIQAKELRDADVGFVDKSDSYCICTVDGVSYQTKTLGNSLNPVWNEHCTLVQRDLPTEIRFELWDSDESLKDEGLGKVIFPLKGFFDSDHAGFDGWLDITPKGKINVCIKGTHMKPQAMKEALYDLQRNNEALKKELDGLREQHVKSDQQIANLTENLQKAEKQNSDWTEKTSNLEKQNVELKDKVIFLEKQNKELFERYKNLEGLNAELSHQERVKVETLTTKLELLEKEKETSIKQLESDLIEQRQNYERLNQQYMELTTTLATQRETTEALAASNAQKNNMIAELQLVTSQSHTKTSALMEENQALRKELMDFREQLTEVLQKKDQTIKMEKEKEQTIETLKKTIVDMTNKNESLQSDTFRLQSVIEALTTKLKNMQEETARLAAMNAELATKLEMVQAALHDSKSEASLGRQYNAMIKDLQRELEQREVKCQELASTLASLRAANNANTGNSSSNNNGGNSNNNDNNSTRVIQSLQERVKELTAANVELTRAQRQQETEISTLQQELQRRITYQASTPTSGISTMPLQQRSTNKIAVMGGIALVSTAVFVLMWRMNKRGVAIETSAVLK